MTSSVVAVSFVASLVVAATSLTVAAAGTTLVFAAALDTMAAGLLKSAAFHTKDSCHFGFAYVL